MLLDEGALLVDDFVDAEVGVEVGLDVLEEGDRAVGTSTSVERVTLAPRSPTRDAWATHPNWPRAAMAGEIPMASWKVRRRDSWTSSPHSPPSNRFSWMSSRIANRAQQAALVAVFTPSGQATRRVSAPIFIEIKTEHVRILGEVGGVD